ncbi:FAD-dependent oxidoreductase [Kineococcus radiotolerans]|uniref:Amine oxidase n=1 Tax=Kineococcus radiotolerans (strain ATCC BAA-149 / DSM 14245 / SRS30216) TaxID=266940 RepID=A6WC62_KINRD|nr:FAD-dependent oxidoreductase [Kineococcus radiotolerans]ABS04401.1 amine oxidase [Kineococcus radiotolerans SRS30216 = ATCC BAA-149]
MSAPAVEDVTGREGTDQPVVVIGAGPAGLAAAEHLLDAGVQVVVVDGAPAVGGLSRSIELWGHRFDLGPHSFLSDSHPESVARWLDLAGAVGGVERTEAVRSAVWRGRVVGFPPSPAQVLRTVGALGAARLAGGRVAATLDRRGPAATAHEALVARHGRAVVEELFVPYTRKYLGAHPRELSAAFADKLQGTRRGWSGPVDLLTPREGTGAVWEELARRLRARGARILLDTRVVGLSTSGTRVTGVQVRDAGAEFGIGARAVVSSVPAPVLLRWLPGTRAPAGPALRSRDTHLVHLLVEGPVGQDSHYVTAYDESLRVGRLTNTRVWRPGTFRDEPRTALCAEFWSSGDDDLAARSDHELAQLAVSELPAFGVDPRVRVLDHHVLRLPRSVPVLTLGVEAARADVDEQLDRFVNLARVGRHGRHDWDGQEDSLLTGRSIGAHVLTADA